MQKKFINYITSSGVAEKVANTPPSITPKLYDLLKAIADGDTIKRFGARRGISHQAVYKQRKLLVKKGFLNKDFVPTSLAVEMVGLQASGWQRKVAKVRLHGVTLKVTILRFGNVTNWLRHRFTIMETQNIPYKVKSLRHNDIVSFALDSWRVEVTTKSFLLHPPDVWCQSAWEGITRLFYDAKEVVRRLERRFAVGCLEKDERMCIEVLGQHAAMVDNELAKHYNREKRAFEIRDSNGELRLLIDHSYKFDELEAVHPIWAVYDEGTLREFLADLVEHPEKVSIFRRDIEAMKRDLHDVLDGIKMLGEVDIVQQRQLQELKARIGDRESKDF